MRRVEDLVPKNKFDFRGIDELRLFSDEDKKVIKFGGYFRRKET